MSKREKKREWKACLNETVKGITQKGRERERERQREREREGKLGARVKTKKVKLVAFVLSLKNLINNFYFQSSLKLKFLNEFYHFQKNLIFWESAKVF